MSTLATTHPTLLDVATRSDTDGKIAQIAEILNQTNEILEDAVWVEGNLPTGHKTTARDHPHPTFSPDGRKIQIQSALLAADGREMNICVVPVPKAWLDRQP